MYWLQKRISEVINWFLKNGGLSKIAVFIVGLAISASAMAAGEAAERDQRYAQLDRALLEIVEAVGRPSLVSPQPMQRLLEVQRLLDRGADPNRCFDGSRKAFWYACAWFSNSPKLRAEQKNLVTMLYRHGADDPGLSIRDFSDKSDELLELLVTVDRNMQKDKVALDNALRAKPNTIATWLPDSIAEIIRAWIGAPETIQDHPFKVRCAKVCDPLVSYSGEFYMRSILQKLYVGGFVDIKIVHGRTPLHDAVRQARHRIIELLLDSGLSIDAQDDSGCTPLHYAAWECPDSIVRLLLDNKADTEIQAEDGWTPLMYAVTRSDNPDASIAQLLLESGANCSACDNDGRTALHHAAIRARTHKAAVLLQYRANVNAKDNRGITPLDLAENRKGFEDVAQLLLTKKKESSCGCIVA